MEKDKMESTDLRHVQTDASIEHVFGRISSYGVCLEPRVRTETRPQHGSLVSGRRRCRSCCIAGASAVCRQPGGKKGLRASCSSIFPIASGGNVLQLRLFALVRTHHSRAKLFTLPQANGSPSPGSDFDHTYIRFRPPSIASRLPPAP
jgi:hypothetical protein